MTDAGNEKTAATVMLGAGLPAKQLSARRVYILFLLSAAILFAPFFLQGAVLLSNTDNLFNHYPNLIFGHRTLRSGDLGLWNPFLFAGVDFSQVLHHHMLNPINWILLPVPESFLLQAITIKIMIEISLAGFIAYLIAGVLVSHQLTAIGCGLAFQLSGFTWFTTTAYITPSLLVAMLISVFVLLTSERRTQYLNYCSLTLCFAAILLCGHPAYSIAFIAPAPALVLLCGSGMPLRETVRRLGVVIFAGATALAMASFRILSVVFNLGGTSRMAANLSLDTFPGNNGVLVLPGLVPGIWGVSIYDGNTILKWLKVGENLQIHALAHFSVLPLLLIFTALAGRLGRRACGAAIATVVLAITFFGLMPIASDVANVILGPVYHLIEAKVFAALFGIACVIFACRQLERTKASPQLLRFPLAASLLIGAVCLAVWTKCVWNVPLQALDPYRPALKLMLKACTVILFAGAPAVFLCWNKISLRILSHGVLAGYAALAGVASLLFYRAQLFTGSQYTLQCFVYMSGAVICGALTVRALRRWRAVDGDNRAWKSLVAPLVMAVAIAVLPIPPFHGDRTESVIFAGAMLAVGRFLAMAVLGVELLSFVTELGWRPALPFLLVFLFADAMLLNRAYDNVGARGFERPSNMYPAMPFRMTRSSASPSAGPNLIQTEPLAAGSGVDLRWTAGGTGTQVAHSKSESHGVVVRGAVESTLFEDIKLPPGTHQVAFGAWVKSSSPKVALFLTAKRKGADPTGSLLARSSGKGRWEWLIVPLNSVPDLTEARPHFVVGQGAEGEMLGPVLGVGERVFPGLTPKDVPAVELQSARAQTEELDRAGLAQFRVNFPVTYLGDSSEPLSNIAMIYGFRTYGGVDSVLNPEIARFATSFVPEDRIWFAPFGIRNILKEPRFLDLMGARYDYGGGPRIHLNALPRLALFDGFEVAEGFEPQLARLKDSAFDYTTRVVLDSFPGGNPQHSTQPSRFEPVAYTQISTSHIRLKKTVQRPSILLFNDSLAPDWHAYRNGVPTPIVRANAHFMAIALPAGNSEVDFQYEPALFYLLAKISLATAILFGAVWIWYMLVFRRRPSRAVGGEPVVSSTSAP
jgi:hypothetical protein